MEENNTPQFWMKLELTSPQPKKDDESKCAKVLRRGFAKTVMAKKGVKAVTQ